MLADRSSDLTCCTAALFPQFLDFSDPIRELPQAAFLFNAIFLEQDFAAPLVADGRLRVLGFLDLKSSSPLANTFPMRDALLLMAIFGEQPVQLHEWRSLLHL